MWKRCTDKLKREEGSSIIEFTIALLIFVLLVAFFVDMLMIGGKRFLIAQETTGISRVIGVQGGVSSAVPVGYPGGDRSYLTSLELYKKINEKMADANIESTEWTATLTEYNTKGQVIRELQLTPQSNFRVDYMHSMDIEISASYQWKMMNVITGGVLNEASVGAKRHTVSEFKYNFDEWEGEGY